MFRHAVVNSMHSVHTTYIILNNNSVKRGRAILTSYCTAFRSVCDATTKLVFYPRSWPWPIVTVLHGKELKMNLNVSPFK